MFYIANGLLSSISDNVFVATVYISEVAAFDAGTISREHFGTILLSPSTQGPTCPLLPHPNGQVAFLFCSSSAIAPLVRLSYGRMFFNGAALHHRDELWLATSALLFFCQSRTAPRMGHNSRLKGWIVMGLVE